MEVRPAVLANQEMMPTLYQAPSVDAFQMQEHAYHVMQNFQHKQEMQSPPPPPQHLQQQQLQQQQQQEIAADEREAGGAGGSKRQRQNDGTSNESTSSLLRGSDVMVKLRNNGRVPFMEDTFEVSLQVFLDTIDAGGQFISAQSSSYVRTDARVEYPQKQSPDSIVSSSSTESDAVMSAGYATSAGYASSAYEAEYSAPMAHGAAKNYGAGLTINTMGLGNMQSMGSMHMDDVLPSPHWTLGGLAQDMSEVGAAGIWSQHSRGDQAYFFYRNAESAPFSNGSVVALRDGQLEAAADFATASLFLVVSDENALWKGEPHPTPQQEEEGHWCAFLGQVPLWVEGPVKAGQYLGPVGDGSGLARVVQPGKEPAVAIALESKGAGLEALKCMVSVGLNSLNVGAAAAASADAQQAKSHAQLVARLDSASSKVENAHSAAVGATKLAKEGKAAAHEAKAAASAAESSAARAETGVSRLNTRVHGLADDVRDNRQLLDDMQEDLHVHRVSRRQVCLQIPLSEESQNPIFSKRTLFGRVFFRASRPFSFHKNSANWHLT